MKIKSDFVTNSSSTAYVVFIPNRFKANEHEIKKFYEDELYIDEDPKFSPLIIAEANEVIEKLKEGESIWTYSDEGLSSPIYYTILNICQKYKMVVSSSEMGGEGNNTIFGVREEKVHEIMFNNIDMDEFFKTTAKGESVCCEVKKDLP